MRFLFWRRLPDCINTDATFDVDDSRVQPRQVDLPSPPPSLISRKPVRIPLKRRIDQGVPSTLELTREDSDSGYSSATRVENPPCLTLDIPGKWEILTSLAPCKDGGELEGQGMERIITMSGGVRYHLTLIKALHASGALVSREHSRAAGLSVIRFNTTKPALRAGRYQVAGMDGHQWLVMVDNIEDRGSPDAGHRALLDDSASIFTLDGFPSPALFLSHKEGEYYIIDFSSEVQLLVKILNNQSLSAVTSAPHFLDSNGNCTSCTGQSSADKAPECIVLYPIAGRIHRVQLVQRFTFLAASPQHRRRSVAETDASRHRKRINRKMDATSVFDSYARLQMARVHPFAVLNGNAHRDCARRSSCTSFTASVDVRRSYQSAPW